MPSDAAKRKAAAKKVIQCKFWCDLMVLRAMLDSLTAVTHRRGEAGAQSLYPNKRPAAQRRLHCQMMQCSLLPTASNMACSARHVHAALPGCLCRTVSAAYFCTQLLHVTDFWLSRQSEVAAQCLNLYFLSCSSCFQPA